KAQKKKSAGGLLDRLAAWKALREQAIQLAGVIDGLMIASLRSQWDAFAAKSDARANNLSNDLCGDGIPNPHELRIAAKMLRYTFPETRRQPLEHRALAVGMKRAHDSHSRAGGGEGVVMTQLAREEQVGSGLDRIVDHLATRAGAAGGASDRAGLRAGDEEV